jgi:lysophospholipid acyltransferase
MDKIMDVALLPYYEWYATVAYPQYDAACLTVGTYFAPLASHVDSVAAEVGMTSSQFRFILSLFLCVFLSFGLRFTRRGLCRDVTVSMVGLALLYFSLNRTANYCVFAVLVAYMLLGRPVAMVAFTLTYLSWCHIYRMWTAYMSNDADFSAPLMIIVLKCIATCFNVADGRPGAKPSPTAAAALKKKPSLMEFLAFCFFFPGLLVGPVFDFCVYREFRSAPTLKRMLWRELGGKFLWVAFMGVLFVIGDTVMTLEMLNPSALATHWFGMQLLILSVVLCLQRARYYLVWYLAEASFVVCHLPQVTNADFWGTEFASSPASACNRWNHSVASWLQRYIYFRVSGQKKAGALAQLCTFIVSSVWHGFMPGYFFFFVSLSFLVTISKNLRTIFRSILFNPRTNAAGTGSTVPVHGPVTFFMYKFVATVCSILGMSYLGAPFLLMDFGIICRFYNHFAWSGHYLTFALLVASTVGARMVRSGSGSGKAQRKRDQTQEQATAPSGLSKKDQ